MKKITVVIPTTDDTLVVPVVIKAIATVGLPGPQGPAGADGTGGRTLNLSYNGNGPVECVAFINDSWDTSVGGYAQIIIPASLNGMGVDLTSVCDIDGSGTIQGFILIVNVGKLSYMYSFNATGHVVTNYIMGLTVFPTESSGISPGNFPTYSDPYFGAQAGTMMPNGFI